MIGRSGLVIVGLALAPIAGAAVLMAAAHSPMAAAYAGALAVAARSVLAWAVGFAIGLLVEKPLAAIVFTVAVGAASLLVSPVFDGTGMTGAWLLIAARCNVMLLAAGVGAVARGLARLRPLVRA